MTREGRRTAWLVATLLFGPAAVALVSRPAAYVVSAGSVAALVYLMLRRGGQE
jgi:hypothetical protein